MSKQYFSNHRKIDYGNLKIRNLMSSAKLIRGVLDQVSVTYPYTLQDGETPNMIAADYYGSVEYVWLILMANNIVDPYTQWFKGQMDFDQYIIKKYGSIAQAQQLISHYSDPNDPTRPDVSPTTYAFLPLSELTGLEPVYAYDAEVTLNESRRTINLIAARHAATISLEIERLLGQ